MRVCIFHRPGEWHSVGGNFFFKDIAVSGGNGYAAAYVTWD